MEEKSRLIIFVDYFILMYIVFCWLGTLPWEGTTFQKLVITFLIDSIFLVLTFTEVVGTILKVLISGVWTAALMALIPFSSWVNGDIKWLIPIAAFVYICVLSLHGTNIFKLKDYLNKRQHLNKIKKKIKKTEAQTGEHISHIIEMFETDKVRSERIYATMSEEFYQKNRALIADIYSFIEWGNTLCRQRYTEAFYSSFPDFEKNTLAVHDVLDAWERNRQNNAEREQGELNNPLSGSESNRSLFAGCKTSEDLKKRYLQLMKTFHPDVQYGDKEMTQTIQNTYEELVKEFHN